MLQKIKNLKVKKKLSISLRVTTSLLILSMLISIGSLGYLTNRVNEFYKGVYKVKDDTYEININFERLQKFLFLAVAMDNVEKSNVYITSANEIGDNNLELLNHLSGIFDGDVKTCRLSQELSIREILS